MQTYAYKALTADGAEARGVVQAMDEYDAANQIKEKYKIITSLSPVGEKKSLIPAGSILTKDLDPRVKTRDLALMCSQFAITLKSGIPIGRAISMIGNQTKDKKLKKILLDAAENVTGGMTVANAFERHKEAFPITFLETIRAGELSGTLDNAFGRMAKYYENAAKNQEKVRSALMYPIFVLIIAIIVLMVVMVKVIPTLAQVFDSLGGQMPLITRMMISMSRFFQHWWLLICLVIVALIVAWKSFTRTEKGRILQAKLQLLAPIFGKINESNGAAQFATTMATLIGSGLTVNNAIATTAKVMDNYLLHLDVEKMTPKVEQGRNLAECFQDTEWFPATLKEMTAVGEESGELDQTLDVIGEYYTTETNRLMANAIAAMEPTLLCIMAVFAGFIIFAIYMPMFTMYNLF